MMISALNTCLVVHQRKAKVLREAGLKSKQSQHHYFSLLLHFTGIEKKTNTLLVKKVLRNLNNYFDFHVCLSIRPSFRLSVCPKNNSISCTLITKCH